ncbi:HAD-IA family hydrolase [uncultured Megamonas sp.]|uniref:HAD-IA family hydrolase n=1 Tax=Megamonas funiformis TaxID=437897 RepID=UPI0025D75CAB|nr:HAD-IA family hydrolase [uncultured Megamonas sp.]
MNKFKYILFDLDGTLIDSGKGIINAVKYALKKYGIDETNEALLRSFVGPPLNQQFAKCYGFSAEKSLEAVMVFREYYETKGILENEMYKDIDKVLKHLKEQGNFLMVATSKPEKFAHNILAQHDLEKYFDFIGGSLVDGSRVTKIQVLDHVLKTNEINNADEALMIGDTKYDMIGAKNFNLKTVAVTYGYGTKEELLAAKPDFVVDTPTEILQIVKA